MMRKQKINRLRYVIDRQGVKHTKIHDVISIENVISIVGGGGKTHTMYTLGEESAWEEKNVILTTTTRILPFDNTFPPLMSVVCREAENGKLQAPENVKELISQCDLLLIEADGSKGLPIKMPAAHEPAIFPESDQVIAILGLSGIGKPIKEVCHRPEIVASFLKKTMEEAITVEDVAKILLSPYGLRKNVSNRKYSILLNQADTEERIRIGLDLMKHIPKEIPCAMTAYELEM